MVVHLWCGLLPPDLICAPSCLHLCGHGWVWLKRDRQADNQQRCQAPNLLICGMAYTVSRNTHATKSCSHRAVHEPCAPPSLALPGFGGCGPWTTAPPPNISTHPPPVRVLPPAARCAHRGSCACCAAHLGSDGPNFFGGQRGEREGGREGEGEGEGGRRGRGRGQSVFCAVGVGMRGSSAPNRA